MCVNYGYDILGTYIYNISSATLGIHVITLRVKLWISILNAEHNLHRVQNGKGYGLLKCTTKIFSKVSQYMQGLNMRVVYEIYTYNMCYMICTS